MVVRGKGSGRGGRVGPGETEEGTAMPPRRRSSVKSDKSKKKCNIPLPICGAWCMPTENPDESCFRHFSNEMTVPVAGCMFACLPCLEKNKFCQITGKMAFQVGQGVRKIIFTVGMILSFVIMVFMLLGVLSILPSEGNVRTFHWIKATTVVKPKASFDAAEFTKMQLTKPGTAAPAAFTIDVYMSPHARVVDFIGVDADEKQLIKRAFQNALLDTDLTGKPDPDFKLEEVEVTGLDTAGAGNISFAYYTSEFCPLDKFETSNICYSADATNDFSFLFMMVTMVFFLQLSAAGASCQRFTEFGDVNCQKFWGFLAALLTCLSAFSTYFMIQSLIDKMPKTLNPIAAFNYAEPGLHTEPVTYESTIWVTLIYVGAYIKIADVLIHCLIATPPGRHATPKESNPYVDLPDYMLRFQDADHPAIPYSANH